MQHKQHFEAKRAYLQELGGYARKRLGDELRRKYRPETIQERSEPEPEPKEEEVVLDAAALADLHASLTK